MSSSVKVAHEIKSLRTQLEKKKGELEGLKVEREAVIQKYRTTEAEISGLLKKIKSLETEREITVSEHALLRYCERVLGIDLEEVSNIILTEDVKTLVNSGQKFVKTTLCEQRFELVAQDNTIVTINPVEKTNTKRFGKKRHDDEEEVDYGVPIKNCD